MLLKFNIEFKQLIIINPEHKKYSIIFIFKEYNCIIFSEIIIETKKNIMLIGKADDKKNTKKMIFKCQIYF